LGGDELAFIDQLEKPVAFWHNALLNGNKRRSLTKLKDPVGGAVIDFPDPDNKGAWSLKHGDRLEQAAAHALNCESISAMISEMKSLAIRNTYTLEVYEQVNDMVGFTCKALLALKAYDSALSEQEESDALDQVRQLPEEFKALRTKFEQVYGETRILTKPNAYILDQDHHNHLANQSISFDWQFYAEMLFLEKIQDEF
jgi:hexosaminidase